MWIIKGLLFLIIFFNIFLGNGISYTYISGPVPSDAILIYQSREYSCSEGYKAYNDHLAGKELNGDTPVPWIDISSYITAAHRAQGFIDILLTVSAEKASDKNDPRWKFYGDADDRGWHDFRASCDEKLYDMIAPGAKKQWEGWLFTADCEDYCILRFKVPSEIYGGYKIFLGQYNIRADVFSGADHYANWYQVRLYTLPLPSRPYVHVEIDNAPEYEYEYIPSRVTYTIPEPVWKVWVNTPVKFDASKSVDTSGNQIICYRWDFNGDNVWDEETETPYVIHRYTKVGEYHVIVEVENTKGITARNTGSNLVDESSASLPLYVNVINKDCNSNIFLYQNAPNPFYINSNFYTTIRFTISEGGFVTINVYDFRRRFVKQLFSKYCEPGTKEVKWFGYNDSNQKVPTGIYFYEIIIDSEKVIKAMMVINED